MEHFLFLLLVLTGAASASGQEEVPYLTREECRVNGEKLLGDVSFLLENADAVSCASGAGERCCRALNEYFGPNSTFWGCPCYADLFQEGLEQLPSFARPLVQQRLADCAIPTLNSGCKAVETNGSLSTASAEPNLGQSGTMMQYSGPWSYATKGYDSYGEWYPCIGVEGAQYCVSLVTPPGVYSETKWGVCVSDALDNTTINAAIAATNPEHYAMTPPKTFCTYPKTLPDWTPGAIGVAAFLIALGALTVLATIFGCVRRNFFSVEGEEEGDAGRSVASRVALKLVSCFDLQPNWKGLVKEPKIEEQNREDLEAEAPGRYLTIDLRSLNGLRTLSMFWIILGHTGSTIFFNFDLSYFSYWGFNPENYKWIKDWYFPIYAGVLGVDSFLFISGLLVAYKFSQQMGKRCLKSMTWTKEIQFWSMYCVARWLRLLPVLLVVMFTVWKLIGQLITAPGWHLFWDASYVNPCDKYWWATLLFIQNIYPGGESFGNKGNFCIPVSWYLAVDMQLYIFVAPVVLITYHYGLYTPVFNKCRKYMGTGVVFTLMAVSVGLTAWIVINHNVMWQFLGVGDFDRYYITPWTRAPPYLFGMLLGLLLYELQKKEKNLKLYRFFANLRAWALAALFLVAFGALLLLAFTPTFYLQTPPGTLPPLSENSGTGMEPEEVHTYMILRYFGWGFCLMVMFGITCIGRGWVVNDLLAGYFWAPLAKLTFCAYLIGIVIQDVTTQSLINHPVYYNTWTMLSYWVVFVVGAYALSLACYLCVEAPFGNMLRYMMSSVMPTQAQRKRSPVGSAEPASLEPPKTAEAALNEEVLSPGKEIFSPRESKLDEEREAASSTEIEMLKNVTKSFLASSSKPST
ncbi:acyltransferase domain-containing protein [Chloropicon primus]|uniref:Acyltransferase 3 domain-containing protein n=1 Tax=Chloropicon primus TaxID=1764295 RepID=A0A5B8MJ80_9CHLO|nr:hypothetical protein A3770_04p31960 [Chloropicon primus]UPQ99890.1 acyltransferase domain-containing protein [Chloropicon primus]|eukprot:QDZ20678.1 hypothetical protein A3770_04p31960 [Chloropicon primus]